MKYLLFIFFLGFGVGVQAQDFTDLIHMSESYLTSELGKPNKIFYSSLEDQYLYKVGDNELRFFLKKGYVDHAIKIVKSKSLEAAQSVLNEFVRFYYSKDFRKHSDYDGKVKLYNGYRTIIMEVLNNYDGTYSTKFFTY